MGDPGLPGPQGLRGGTGDRVSGCLSWGVPPPHAAVCLPGDPQGGPPTAGGLQSGAPGSAGACGAEGRASGFICPALNACDNHGSKHR